MIKYEATFETGSLSGLSAAGCRFCKFVFSSTFLTFISWCLGSALLIYVHIYPQATTLTPSSSLDFIFRGKTCNLIIYVYLDPENLAIVAKKTMQ